MAIAMETIKVEEVMSKNPLIISDNITISEAAKLMKERGVSTVIIEKDGKPLGIVTDRDFVTKVLAAGLDPRKTGIYEIMSSPVIMIPHDESISAAAKVMSRNKIRKLPVIKNGSIVGILSENDIVRISPDLVALAVEYSKMHHRADYREMNVEYIAGKCEVCGEYSLRLIPYEGTLVCPECYENLR